MKAQNANSPSNQRAIIVITFAINGINGGGGDLDARVLYSILQCCTVAPTEGRV